MVTTEREKTLNELGDLETKLAPYREALKREKVLRDQVRTWPDADRIAAYQSAAYSTARYTLALGPRENQRRIQSVNEVYKLLGKAKFVAAASFTLKALDALVEPHQVARLVVSERTGSRTVTIAPAAKEVKA